ncbi:HAD family hydrolase [Paenibacillus zeisoli]|uniref:HAD family hydrolase n=1 Tax=Paenibacillus zeisoli TaxID=2496267 RepID=A0A3S1D8B8_9BACL|nr:HAD family hydrolase [Paenibacillus zeisoli]RUT30548.1 HAD family hydrolase [Paenibacillus zeisoli]
MNNKAVFFDVDDTLYDHLSPLRSALMEVLGLPEDFPYERAYYLFRYYSDLLSDEEGLSAVPDKSKMERMRTRRFILSLAELGVHVTEEQAGRLQAAYLRGQFEIRPFEGAVTLIRRLSEAGYVVGLITNGPKEHQMSKILAMEMEKLVPLSHIFVSGAVGIAKPDPRLFTHVNASTGTLAADCHYIGDSWRNDVVGSLGAGWTSIWFNHRGAKPESDHTPHYIVSTFEEIGTLYGVNEVHKGTN